MKTISLELSKRLAPYLQDIDTQVHYRKSELSVNPQSEEDYWYYLYGGTFQIQFWCIKTLTLEEIIAFLQNNMIRYDIDVRYTPRINKIIYKEESKENLTSIETDIMWETLLETMQKTLEYLLDNNLLKWQS